jgi:hypothetical protein
MRFPLRLTTRRWMLAILILGLLLGPGAEVVRLMTMSRRFRQGAIACRKIADRSRNTAAMLARDRNEAGGDDVKVRQWLQAGEERWIRYGDHYSRLAPKYDRAARYPWLPLEPDPPAPEYPISSEWRRRP